MLLATGLVLLLAFDPLTPRPSGATEPARTKKDAAVVPLPQEVPSPRDNPTTAAKVALGKQLFFDPRLSGDNKSSCASCHHPKKGFGDGAAKGRGRGGKTLDRNVPSLLNVGFYSSYLWDGRTKSLEEQALMPITSADEMNQDLGELEKELNAVPGYVTQFETVFGNKVTRDGIAKALAAFQRALITKPSRFDRYLKGDKEALSDAAKEGLRLFTGDAGCVRCHNGPLLSDGKFYRLGVQQRDKGRGAITGKKGDDYRFRTPGLRNMAQTGPYMHDGSQTSLEDVVTYYYRNMPTGLDVEPLLGQSFSEISPIVAFLESLTGEAPEISPPKLP